MTALNKQALRILAVALDGDDWHAEGNSVYGGRYDVGDNVCYDHIASCESVNGESPHADFISAANPATMLALLDENESMARDLISRDGEIEGLRQRVAELEARYSVHSYHKWSPGLVHPEDCQCGDCRAAGIGVKGG